MEHLFNILYGAVAAFWLLLFLYCGARAVFIAWFRTKHQYDSDVSNSPNNHQENDYGKKEH